MHDFKTFTDQLNHFFNGSILPGLEAQLSMAPSTRIDELKRMIQTGEPKQSAVLVLFYPMDGKIKLVFIKRPKDNSIHSGQIAFPGGRVEEDDQSFDDTALREAKEEVNIDPGKVKVVGALSKLHIPPSNYDVYPIVGYAKNRPDFKGNDEVDKILEVELNHLLDPKTKTTKTIHHRLGKLVDIPCYYIQGEIIWGATAMMLGELLAVINNKR